MNSLALALLLAVSPDHAAGTGFTKVTVPSGVEAIVQQKYQADPDWWLSGLHLVDLDADGDLDLFLSAHGGGAVATLNSGGGVFALAPGTYPGSEIHLYYDGDEDGRADLTMTHEDGGGRWWRNLSVPGTLSFVATGVTRGGNTARSQVLFDVNEDGKVDWLRGAPPGLHVDLGNGTGGFAEASATLAIPGTHSNNNANFLPSDLDGDGDVDLLAMVGGGYDDTAGRTAFYRNQGGTAFVDATPGSGLPANGTVVKGVGDFDHDGDTDLIAIENKTMPPVVYLNAGAGTFTRLVNAVSGIPAATLTYSAWGTAVTTDFDNDGVLDVIMNGKYYLKVLRGTGGGRFAYVNAAWGIRDDCACSVDDGLAFGDIDADGDLDIVGYRETWPTRLIDVYRNDVAAGRWVRVRAAGRAGNRGAAGATIRLYAPGTQQLLWSEQVALYCFQAANSYYGRAQTERHFGLGERASVDVEVAFQPSGAVTRRNNVAANSVVLISEPAPDAIFADGFESGDLSAWSTSQP
jgi:hypothetical protein